MYIGEFEGTSLTDAAALQGSYTYNTLPILGEFEAVYTQIDQGAMLKGLQLMEMEKKDVDSNKMNLMRQEFVMNTPTVSDQSMILTFQNSDTEELQGVQATFKGDRAMFKVGEGQSNHYQIPNDKKLMDSQFMIVNKDGQFFLRDLGFVHNTRIKLDLESDFQIQQGTVVDVGKVIHYHFDKLTHYQEPTEQISPVFHKMRPEVEDYKVDRDDFPYLRARPTWISPEENLDNIQNEINIFADGSKAKQKIGRSSKRDIQLKLKAISAEHCNILYDHQRGWHINEKGKSKVASNGTYVFLKSNQQLENRVPSDMLPLHDGMLISFINYELRVNFEPRSKTEVNALHYLTDQYFKERPAGALGNFPDLPIQPEEDLVDPADPQ